MFLLNHEIVNRVLRKAKIPCGASNSEAREDDRAIEELCELWLQKWTLEWTEKIVDRKSTHFSYSLIEVGSMDCYGRITFFDNEFSSILNKNGSQPVFFENETAARNWLATEAAKDGYAIKRDVGPAKFLSWDEPIVETGYRDDKRIRTMPCVTHNLSSNAGIYSQMKVYSSYTTVILSVFEGTAIINKQFDNEKQAREFIIECAKRDGYGILAVQAEQNVRAKAVAKRIRQETYGCIWECYS